MCQPDQPTVQSGAYRLSTLVYQDTGVVIELDDAPVWPLALLCCAYYNRMSDIAAADLVGGADGHAASRAGLGTEVSLFLDDDNNTIA